MGANNSLNISEAGYVTFDGVNTFHGRTFQQGTGIILTNASGVVGNTTISTTASLTDLHAPRFIVSNTDLTHGANYATIASALSAAVALGSPQTVFVQPGTYTETLTLASGINICAFSCDSNTPNVTIIGVCTATFTGSCSISGINFQTNGLGSSIVVSGSNATVVNLTGCNFNTTSGTSISNSASNIAAIINVNTCRGDISVVGGGNVVYQVTGTGTINFYSSYFTNSGLGVSANGCSSGVVNIFSSLFSNGVACTVSGITTILDSSVLNSGINTACLDLVSNVGGTITCSNCYLDSGTASAISLNGSNAIVNALNSTLKTSNTNAIVRAGSTPTIKFGNLSFIGTSSLIDALLTQVPFISTNDAVKIKSPGAYPYTTIPQDTVILVDSSSARTIVPLASPTTGQMHRIKDNVGSAAANNITITPSGKNIDGAASYVINTNYGAVDIVYNGTEWSVL